MICLRHSIIVNYTMISGLRKKSCDGQLIKLVNDELTPGANKYYGTNGSGVKGWYDLP